MTKLGRRAIYGDTCAQPGCTEPRAVLSVRKGTPSRSRYCRQHFNADALARYNAKHAPEPEPAGCTVAEAYALWAVNSIAEFWYKQRRVYGIRACAIGYTLVLAGADSAQWVAETTRLEVAP